MMKKLLYLCSLIKFVNTQYGNDYPYKDERALPSHNHTHTFTVPLSNLTLPVIKSCVTGDLEPWQYFMMYTLFSDIKKKVPPPEPSMTSFENFWCHAFVQHLKCDFIENVRNQCNNDPHLNFFKSMTDLCSNTNFHQEIQQAKANVTLFKICEPYLTYSELQVTVNVNWS